MQNYYLAASCCNMITHDKDINTHALQVNQAMKFGVPVVATNIAVEGMHVRDGQDCMVADSPEQFASKVAQVYTDCSLWHNLAQAASKNVAKWFSVNSAKADMLESLRLFPFHHRNTSLSRVVC
jgi:glycosyltransferase involved in cell wall biosynthesis